MWVFNELIKFRYATVHRSILPLLDVTAYNIKNTNSINIQKTFDGNNLTKDIYK